MCLHIPPATHTYPPPSWIKVATIHTFLHLAFFHIMLYPEDHSISSIQGCSLFLLKAAWCCTVRPYGCSFTQSPLGGHLGGFQSFATVRSTVVNSLCILLLYFWWVSLVLIPPTGIAGTKNKYICDCAGYCRLSLHGLYPFAFLLAYMCVFSQPHQQSILKRILDIWHSDR